MARKYCLNGSQVGRTGSSRPGREAEGGLTRRRAVSAQYGTIASGCSARDDPAELQRRDRRALHARPAPAGAINVNAGVRADVA